MEKHFVTFYSPGTFVAEETTKPIESWDVQKAVEMADEISERYGALPYGFVFTTRTRTDKDLDSEESARGPMHYLGGTVETLSEIELRNDPKEATLLSNMRGNGWDKVIINTNSYRWTQPFRDGDVLLDWMPKAKRVAAQNPLTTTAADRNLI